MDIIHSKLFRMVATASFSVLHVVAAMLVHSLTNVDASKYVLQVLIPSQYCASSSRLASARRVLSASSHMT